MSGGSSAGPLPVFVISLSRSAKRRERSARGFASIGIPSEVVDAVDGRDLGDLPVLAAHQPHLGRALTPGEVGCLESHLSILTRIVDEHLPVACICEDDVRFDDDGGDVLRAVARQCTGVRPARWDVLLLGHHSARRPPDAGVTTCLRSFALTRRRRIARVAEFAMGAYAYVVTRRGAERLLAHARPLRMPMDWITGYSPVVGARLFAVTPPCTVPDDAVPSTIGARPVEDSGLGPADSRRARQAARTGSASAVRATLGRCWLAARRCGLWPDGYVRPF